MRIGLLGLASPLLRAPTAALGAAHPPSVTSLFAALSPFALATRTMKVVSSLKKRCESCKVVKRGTIAYIYCTANPRHKARQGPKRRR